MKVDAVSSLTGGDMQSRPPPQFTDREKRDELAREVNLRKSVYPGMVRQGRLTHQQAERQKAIMYAIWLDYCARVNADETQPQTALDLSASKPEVIGVDLSAGDDRSDTIAISAKDSVESCGTVVDSDASCSDGADGGGGD